MVYSTQEFSDLNVIARLSTYFPSTGVVECHVMLNIKEPGASFSEQLDSISAAERIVADLLKDYDVKPVIKRYFLSDAANQSQLLPEVIDPITVSVIEQPPLKGTKIALWIYLASDMECVRGDGGLIEWRHGSYRHVWYAGGGIPDFSSEVATMTLLDDYAIRLDNLDMNFADQCVRTWFYVQNVDVNYSGVVKGRNSVFKSVGLTPDTHFIASTGIGGQHKDHRVKVQLDAYAVGGLKDGQLGYLYAPEYLNSTYEYGVAFERGSTIDYGDRRHLYISGTASIDNRGQVVYPGDVCKQTDRMLENVEALLNEGGATFDDVSHMTVYLRDMADYHTVNRIFEKRFPETPIVIVHAPVCRPGWLIEMECMAITHACNPQYEPM